MSDTPFVILYVEDNDLIRESFAELLEGANRQVFSVSNGASAREVMRETPVNLLMTDVDLPDGSGLAVAREALSKHPALPVIVCSGHDVADAAQALGPTVHVLRKPVDLFELEALVDRLAR